MYVLLPLDEVLEERRFSEEVIRKAAEFRAQWIEREVSLLMQNPIDLLCDMNGSNTLIRSVLNAETTADALNAVVNLKLELRQYAGRVAEVRFTGGRV